MNSRRRRLIVLRPRPVPDFAPVKAALDAATVRSSRIAKGGAR